MPEYYAVENPAKEVVQTVEAYGRSEAERKVRREYDGDGTLYARPATKEEEFEYLVAEIGLSHADLGEKLDVSKNYIGSRLRRNRDVRRLDVLALERFRELREGTPA